MFALEGEQTYYQIRIFKNFFTWRLFMENMLDKVTLGKTDIQISPLGLGAWAWGDRVVWGYGQGGYTDQDIHQAFDVTIASGVNFLDTAEVYGSGRSERLLGRFLPEIGDRTSAPLVIATKFFPFPWRLTRGSLKRALQNSLRRLDLEKVDLYQIHWPWPPIPVESWAEALADVVQDGLARAVGVSNFSEDQMRRAYERLARRGVALASNQVQYHLLDRKVEFNGLLKTCHELGITLIAYSPIAKGILTGKYTPESPPPGVRSRVYNRQALAAAQPLLKAMREVGEAHGGKSLAQVALNWLICKGTVPIPGAKNARQAQENAGALGWRLTDDEVAQLDEISRPLSS